MKKKLYTITMMSLVLVTIGCSSDEETTKETNTPTPNSTCEITKITYGTYYGNKQYTTTYTNGNLVKLTSTENNFVFTYNTKNELIKREEFTVGSSQITTKEEYTLNTNGQITEVKQWDTYNGNLIYVGKDVLKYNGNKLIEVLDYNEDNTTVEGKHTFEWTGENPTKMKVYNENNTLECETTITYDLSKDNKFNSSYRYFMFQNVMDDDSNLYMFLGKNLITTTKNSCSNETQSYNYNLLGNGLVNTLNINGKMNMEFDYNCK